MMTRRTPGTTNATLRSNHLLTVCIVAILWLQVTTTGYSLNNKVVSPCSKNNAGCQHKCSKVYVADGKLSYKCICNTVYQLAEDKHSCVLVDEFLLYSNQLDIKGKFLKNVLEQTELSIRNKYTDDMRQESKIDRRDFGQKLYKFNLKNRYSDKLQDSTIHHNMISGLDFDAHDNYVYYSYPYTIGNVHHKFIISRIHPNGTGSENVLARDMFMLHLAVDWVAKNLYYTYDIYGTLNVVSIRNTKNRRVLLNIKMIKFLVVHPNKGYIFFIEALNIVRRACMDGSNLISYEYSNNLVWLRGLAVDFAKDRIYWSDYLNNLIYHSNLDLKDVISIKLNSVRRPLSLVIYKDWMYISFELNGINKLHKMNGELVEELNFIRSSNLKIFSKHEQFINNTHPCSIATNYGGCQKLCFAVPSNKSNTSSLQALCGCSVGEKVDADGKSCVVMTVSGGVIKHISYLHVTFVSLIVMFLFGNLLVID